MIPFAELKIDALLVSALPNIRYLSGFTGDNGLLLAPEAPRADPAYRDGDGEPRGIDPSHSQFAQGSRQGPGKSRKGRYGRKIL